MDKDVAKTPQARSKSAANRAKKRDAAAKSKRIGDESATEMQRVRYAYAPLLQQFRSHTAKNQARLWIPIETNLISRYEFATLTTHTRYIFVAIMLYCAGNGIDEIPLDAKFMSSVLNADFRSIENSFDELLGKNLLVERKERKEKKEKKEQTDRPETADAGVSVSDENLFKTADENQNAKPFDQKANAASGHLSQFDLDECKRYVEKEIQNGATINNVGALAMKLFKTGEADSFIKARLYPEEFDREQFGAPVKFSDEPCSVCFGAKMADADGKGFRACEHCRNERGKATGWEPEKEESEKRE